MSYLIDGHNLIPKVPGLHLGDIDVEIHLIKLLQIFCRQQRKKVDVYFDQAPAGQVRTQKYGSVTAHFIRQGSSADAAIISQLQKLGRSARNWTVVTSDRKVAVSSKNTKAKVISSEEFVNSNLHGNSTDDDIQSIEAEKYPDSDEIEEWLRIFKEGNGK